MKQALSLLAALGCTLFLVHDVQAAKYKVDTTHSSVRFKIRHLLSKTTGRFTKFSANIEFDAKKPKQTKISAVIDINSINTDSAKRDAHLKNKDFFDVKTYPKMTFKSVKVTKVKRKGKHIHMHVLGHLKIKKTTKPVVLKVVFSGEKNFGGFYGTRAGFSATTSIDRHKFGVSTGKRMLRLALGAKVSIDINIEATKQK
jgi:polyisoprenoid-binding protein YceI